VTIQRIAEVVGEIEGGKIPPDLRSPLREMVLGTTCQGSKFHSPTPLLVRPIYLSDLVILVADSVINAPPLHEDKVFLCATCEDNIAVYVTIKWAYDGMVPKKIKRDFGNIIHDLGDRAWEYHLKRSAPAPV
jgi:hypothetical protein